LRQAVFCNLAAFRLVDCHEPPEQSSTLGLGHRRNPLTLLLAAVFTFGR